MPDRRPPHPLAELTRTRFLEFVREPEALFWVFAFPILLAFALGIAFRTQAPQPIPVGVVQQDGGEAVLRKLRASDGLAPRVLARDEVDVALRNGRVHLVVEPGRGATPPTYRYDRTRPESRLARLAVDEALQRADGRRDVWSARDELVVTPGSRYIDWLIPGLLGMNVMSTGLWAIGFTVVQARTRKLLKRLVATPMSRGQYLLSHMLARLAFLVLEVGALVTFAWLVFGVPINGSLVTLAAVCLLGALSFAGLGLLVASRARTVEAVSGLLNVVMLPMWILSGVFFSSENFPDMVQPLIQALPLTALNQALRSVMIDGASWTALGVQAGVLTAWGVLSYLVALKIFRWQ